jgi:hypothetical protein
MVACTTSGEATKLGFCECAMPNTDPCEFRCCEVHAFGEGSDEEASESSLIFTEPPSLGTWAFSNGRGRGGTSPGSPYIIQSGSVYKCRLISSITMMVLMH